MTRLIAVAGFAYPSQHQRKQWHPRRFISRLAWSRKSLSLRARQDNGQWCRRAQNHYRQTRRAVRRCVRWEGELASDQV